MSDKIYITGIPLELSPMERNELKGLNMDTLLKFTFSKATFHGQGLCIIRQKGGETLTPARYRRYASLIEAVVKLPVVVRSDSLSYIYRQRMIEQGVYFIISDKYAFLPSLIANTAGKEKKKPKAFFSPAAQFLLLYYLQTPEMDSPFIIKDLEKRLPYNYLALTRAVSELEGLGLCHAETEAGSTKRISFTGTREQLWKQAQKWLRNPVRKVVYSERKTDMPYAVSHINALAHYSHLNPEEKDTLAIGESDFRKAVKDGWVTNEIEGNFKTEVWMYPPRMLPDSLFVDKLSLYLAMKEEQDPRIEKELYLLINNMQW